jgi:hypothetical protein
VVLEHRVHSDYFSGNLQLQALVSDLTLTSPAFAALPSTFTTKLYKPIELHNPSTGAYEIVYIVGHAASSNTVTVQRGKENTSAQAWPANTLIIDAATNRDLITALTRATLASAAPDPFLGQRVLVTDEDNVLARMLAGWGPAIGLALAAAMGPSRLGGANNPPNSANFMAALAHSITVTPDGSGVATLNWRQAFPTACLGAWAWSIDPSRFIGWCTTMGESTTGATFKFTTVAAGSLLNVTSGPLSIGYCGIGY